MDGAPFRRIAYKDAINDYGTDKPDLRNPLIIKDITEVLSDSAPLFEGKTIKAIKVDGFNKTRKYLDGLSEFVKEKELDCAFYWTKYENGEFTGGISKFIGEKAELLKEKLELEKNALVAIIAGEKGAAKCAGLLRTELGQAMDLIEKNVYKFCWIVDFPMYETEEETGEITFCHNPFSMPQGGLDALNNKNPLEILAYQYDIVCNGYELSSGAVRNHSPEIMVKAFEIAGYDEEVIEKKFSALYNAFKYGAPPHAGIAPGVDRMVMLLLDEPNIREIIAFPMNKNAQDLLMNAPGDVTEKQLREANICIRKE